MPPLVRGLSIINHTFIQLESLFPRLLTAGAQTYGENFSSRKKSRRVLCREVLGREFAQSDHKSLTVDELDVALHRVHARLKDAKICSAMIEGGSETTSIQLNNMLLGILPI